DARGIGSPSSGSVTGRPARLDLAGFSRGGLLSGWRHEEKISRNATHLEKLRFYLHALPERYVVLDLRRGRLRIGVIPGSVGIALAVHFNIMVARRSLPRANALRLAGPQILGVHRARGKILVPFDCDGLVAFRQHRAIPRGFGH